MLFIDGAQGERMANKNTSIKKNFMYQMIYEVLVLILPFVTSPYIARVVGAEGLGVYSYSHSVAYYFVLFSMLGIKNYGNRAIAQARDDQDALNETFSNLLAVHIGVSAICCGVYGIYAVLLKNDQLYAVIQGMYVLSGLFDISWFYFGIEKFKLTVARNMVIRLINISCIFIFVRNADDLWKYCTIMAACNLLSQLTLWAPIRKYIQLVRPSWARMKRHIAPLAVLFIPAIAVSLYKYMDKIMIGAMSSKVQLGYYENAEKVINIPMTIIGSFGTVMLPKMSNLAANDNQSASRRYIALSMRFVMCLAIALTCGCAATGRIFAPVFWGKAFAYAGNLIIGLAITIPFISFANVIRTQYLIPNGKDREYLISVICGAVINLIINGLLIPFMGAMGATIGTIAAEMSVCIIQTFMVRRQLPVGKYVRDSLFFMLAGAAMFAVVYLLGERMGVKTVTLIVQVTVGVVIYCSMSLCYFIKKQDETVLTILKKCRNIIRH